MKQQYESHEEKISKLLTRLKSILTFFLLSFHRSFCFHQNTRPDSPNKGVMYPYMWCFCRKRRGVYGPSPGRQLKVFVDDLNMPAKERYGAQPPIEILRQLIDQGYWFDR